MSYANQSFTILASHPYFGIQHVLLINPELNLIRIGKYSAECLSLAALSCKRDGSLICGGEYKCQSTDDTIKLLARFCTYFGDCNINFLESPAKFECNNDGNAEKGFAILFEHIKEARYYVMKVNSKTNEVKLTEWVDREDEDGEGVEQEVISVLEFKGLTLTDTMKLVAHFVTKLRSDFFGCSIPVPPVFTKVRAL